MSDIIPYTLFLTGFINVTLLIIVFFKNYKNRVNLWFAGFLSACAVWSIGMGKFYLADPDIDALNWLKIFYLGGLFIGYFAFLFSYELYHPKKLGYKAIFGLLLIVALNQLFCLPGESLLFFNVRFDGWSNTFNLAPLYYLPYSLTLSGFFILSIYYQHKAYHKAVGIKKIQYGFIRSTFFTLVIMGSFFSLLLQWVNIYKYLWVGPYASLIFCVTTAFLIIKHQFFDIRLLIGKIVYYALLAILPYTIFNILAYFYETYLGTSLSVTALLIGIPAAILFVIGFNSFKTYLQNYTDTKLINPGYNPLEIATKFNNTISGFLKIEKITESTLDTIQKTIRPNYVGMVVITNTEPFEARGFAHKDQQIIPIERLQFIIDFWPNLNIEPLVYESLEHGLNNKYRHAPHIIGEVKSLMEELKLRAFIPVTQDDTLEGILILGSKEADTPYTTSDVKFLTDIANTVSLSLGRALLYDKSLEFTHTLEQRIEEATEELKDKNVTLEDALLKLEDSRRQERDMIDVMGHELRTPLSIVRNALIVLNNDFTKNKKIEAEKLERYLKMGIESIRREVKLVETLLSATKFEGNRIQLQLTKVDLVDVVNDSIEGQKHRAAEKKLKIIFKEPKDAVEIYVDRVRVQEIMDNFLSNAIKYTAEGNITIKISDEDSAWRVSVIDTGIGISPDDIGSLGKKFFRAKKIFGEKDLYVHPSGTGLGLYVTFQLIEVMGGKRVITSEIGKGSTFAFELPKYKGQEDKMIDQTFMEDKTIEKLREETGKESTEAPDDYIKTEVPGKKLPDELKE